MIQSMDCCFYENYSGIEQRGGAVDPFPSLLTLPEVSDVKRRHKKDFAGFSSKEKKKQGSLTTKWLKENYCACPEVCLPREIVYEQYLEFCRKENIQPACKATFGKLIRSAFPEVSSKRLGARGHSKYHYNGIGIKQSSEYRNLHVPLNEGVTRFSPSGSISEEQNLKKFSLSSKVGTLLPNFPDAEDLIMPVSLEKAKMKTFILMYKTHSQCIVDVAISGNFEEIRLFLLHFWQGFPEHLMSLTSLEVFLDLVALCDCILYRTLLDVLIPPVSVEMPDRLLRDIHNTGMHWGLWVQSSLENMPQKLVEVKMTPARRFCRSLKRCVAFIHLAQVIRPTVSSDGPSLLCEELRELQPVIAHLSSTSITEYREISPATTDIALQQAEQLQDILQNCRSLSHLIESLDKMISKLKGWIDEDKAETRNFLFHWIYMLSKVSCVLTEIRSIHFTTFHLISSLIQEYILLAAENQLDKEQEICIRSRFKKHLKNSSSNVSEPFKSATSCFLVEYKNPVTKKRSVRQKAKETKKQTDCRTAQNAPYRNTEFFPKVYSQLFRTENDSRENYAIQEMPSCEYAASTWPFKNSVTATEYVHRHMMKGTSACGLGNYSSSSIYLNSQANRPQAYIDEVYQYGKESSNVINGKRYVQQEYVTESNETYQHLPNEPTPRSLLSGNILKDTFC